LPMKGHRGRIAISRRSIGAFTAGGFRWRWGPAVSGDLEAGSAAARRRIGKNIRNAPKGVFCRMAAGQKGCGGFRDLKA